MVKIFNAFAEICKKYGINVLGWTVIMATIFLIYVLQEQRVNKIIEYQQDNYKTILEQTIRQVHTSENQEHLENFNARMKNNSLIKNVISSYKKEMNCDQIIICEYHNGFTNISTGVPFCKFSCTYEVVDNVEHQITDFFQGINISNYSSIDEMINNVYLIKNIEYFKEHDNNLYVYLKNKGVKQVGMCEVDYTKHTGFVAVLNYSEKSINPALLLNLSRDIDKLLKNCK